MNCGEIGSRNSQPAGMPELEQIEQQLARQAQPLVEREAAVEVRIVDQPLPADRRARLLEVDAHDDAEIVGELVGELLEALAVLQAGLGIVDRARADDDDQAVVLAVEDADQPRRERA